jgi:Flp pilus assembly protein TadD
LTASSSAQRLQTASELLQLRRPADAAVILATVAAQNPGNIDARKLFGLALRDSGDPVGAEREFAAALALDPRQPEVCMALAAIVAGAGRFQEAEERYRQALALRPGYVPALIGLADLLVGLARFDEALEVTTPAASPTCRDLNIWTRHGAALKGLGRLDEAIAAYARGTHIAPGSAVAEHNLAGALGDAERFAESEQATRRALTKGLDAPETWLVHGRALMGQARLDEAERAFREAISRRPAYVDAHGELAQLIWMRTEDASAACAALNLAIGLHPDEPALRLSKAKLLEYVGDLEGAYATLADLLTRTDGDPALHITASQIIAHADPDRALMHAEEAFSRAPNLVLAAQTLCAANLAGGRANEAARIALGLRERIPLDQHVIGLLATAWRLLGDPRYGELYDYQGLVSAQTIDTPDGWSSLGAYLSDLEQSLGGLHPLRTHPVGQSLRHGTQTLQGLDRLDDPVIGAFFSAIDGPIRRYMARLGQGPDPMRSRNSGAYRFNGVWSVRLRPNGYHTDHLHPMGWISSACYIALPAAVDRGKEGWIKFGQPGVPTLPPLEPEHYIRPVTGQLVLFPSYMWHGTVAFTGDEPRLTIAFDVIPG